MSQTTTHKTLQTPAHVAIIMDGNGRWAQHHGLERVEGHKKGAETAQQIAEEAARLGISYLTLYTFSTENWNRPASEVSALMELLLSKTTEEDMFTKNNICLRVIGDRTMLPNSVQAGLQNLINVTAGNTGLCIVLALSYSSRWEITEATRRIAAEVRDGKLSLDEITADAVNAHLDTAFMPDPDLLIRTGAEKRLSNYLLWQCAYTELFFCDTYWPDFGQSEFRQAIEDYRHRQRRYGKTSEQAEE
jgi:undecaprenyl diphosphate synthase